MPILNTRKWKAHSKSVNRTRNEDQICLLTKPHSTTLLSFPKEHPPHRNIWLFNSLIRIRLWLKTRLLISNLNSSQRLSTSMNFSLGFAQFSQLHTHTHTSYRHMKVKLTILSLSPNHMHKLTYVNILVFIFPYFIQNYINMCIHT